MKTSAWLLILSLSLTACNAPPNTTVSPNPGGTGATAKPVQNQTKSKLTVVTTVAPITNIVSNIAGDRTQVKGIIPEGADSHTFEPRPSDADLLSKANLIIVNGLRLEVPTEKLAKTSKPKETNIYELGNNTITEAQWIYDFSFPKEKGDPNPHLWVNPKYAEAYAKLAAQQLTKLDPEGKEYYEKNLTNYLQRLDELDKVTREVVASIPAKNRKLLTYHDSWAYWAREYGFEVIGAIQPSDFKEPSAQDVAKLIDQIRKSGVPAIFGSEVYPSKVEEQIAREAKVKIANTSDDELPGTGSANAIENTNPQHTYIGMMANNLRIMAANLGGNPQLVDKLNTTNVVGPATTANK
ncbi:zinc ABC transporter substrate-binding protein [Nostoc sp. FACHB-87]|uniref:metal ABC transporter substrate-binding protein n=1 Tax=Nostocales TaxID=1161 RepID=UPI00168222C8|nr:MULTISPECIES: metal ABC transporter substrate-binding protein [Nostocales]MBD2300382.1 zinc ABC transporter substrate-binding protein [Nostoc sp. FACHB-190]MBD2457878.1 zinc ABC transporter substrate-binding protein [Nostoc sp. FACHB-87]MBD2474586.1 zinc ABC transporter substrate-binding protein [Anabaena sp. FACHB-83]MBD2487933.1 zinc ABC transporter substrate-binding protein [Aulosira sp. FACHB-615]